MSSLWKHFAISQDDMDLVFIASKDVGDILTQLDKSPDLSTIVIEILNEKSYQELQDLAIRDMIDLVIEANKVITKRKLAWNVLDSASQLYRDVGSFKSLFYHITH